MRGALPYLFGPLGVGSINIAGQPNLVTVQVNSKEEITAHSAEEILQQQFGWHLPVSSLYYWIRGLPKPNVASVKHFDEFNHLISLQQQGWNIHYLRYSGVNNIDLPSKIILDSATLNLRIVISDWEV